ncbi:hypothetical protein [Actinoallomurus sp. NPDC050550]|uniref:hypothetical protein n=1 Tax=Actinoallomurus sp. NPDC050550 TaxID=3154937 RepID=UPI0033CA3862
MALPSKQGRAYSAGLGVLCLDAPGDVRLTRIDALASNQAITIRGFAVRANPAIAGKMQIALEPGSLRAAGFNPASPQTVDGTCAPGAVRGSGQEDPGREAVELGVELVRTGQGSGRIDGFRLTYQSKDKSEELRIPMTVILCSDSDRTTEECNHR